MKIYRQLKTGRITGKPLFLLNSFIVVFIVLTPTVASASGFLSVGSGGVYTSSSENSNNSAVAMPVILEYQHSQDYRDSWMFLSSFTYIPSSGDDAPDDIMIITAGAMYVKPFYYYRSNITETMYKKNSCLATLLLPVTAMRDTLNNFFQAVIPRFPYAFAGIALLKEKGEPFHPGFSAGAGLTSGGVDLRFRYNQSLRYSGGFIRDIYTAGIEFTLNIPLQKKFIRTEPLID